MRRFVIQGLLLPRRQSECSAPHCTSSALTPPKKYKKLILEKVLKYLVIRQYNESYLITVVMNKKDEVIMKLVHYFITEENYNPIVVYGVKDEIWLENLNEDIVIHRITGDPSIHDLIEPEWLVKKFCVLNDIDKEMVKRNTYQGKNIK